VRDDFRKVGLEGGELCALLLFDLADRVLLRRNFGRHVGN
jgi:hypothetical protein